MGRNMVRLDDVSIAALAQAVADVVGEIGGGSLTGWTADDAGGISTFVADESVGRISAGTLELNRAGGTVQIGQGAAADAPALLLTRASIAEGAGFRLAPGVAPSAPSNGDVWLTADGAFARIGGATKQFAGGGATASGTVITDITVVDGRITAITVA